MKLVSVLGIQKFASQEMENILLKSLSLIIFLIGKGVKKNFMLKDAGWQALVHCGWQ